MWVRVWVPGGLWGPLLPQIPCVSPPPREFGNLCTALWVVQEKREKTHTHKEKKTTLKWILKRQNSQENKKKKKGKIPKFGENPPGCPPPQLPRAVLVLPWPEGPREPPPAPLCPSNGLFVLFRKEFLIGTFFILKRNLYIERCPLLSCLSVLGGTAWLCRGLGVLTLPGLRGTRIGLSLGTAPKKPNFGTRAVL